MHAAASGLARLRRATSVEADPEGPPVRLSAEPMATYRSRFIEAISDDLAMPRALAAAHEVVSAADLDVRQRRALLLDFDRVLGLDLAAPAEVEMQVLPPAQRSYWSAAPPRARLATTSPPTRSATSSPRWASRCATPPRAKWHQPRGPRCARGGDPTGGLCPDDVLADADVRGPACCTAVTGRGASVRRAQGKAGLLRGARPSAFR